jgi:hypothetical protein
MMLRLFSSLLTLVFVASCPGCREGQEKVADSRAEKKPPTERLPEPTSAVDKPVSPLRFTDVLADSGIDFQHTSGDCEEKPFPAANGSGVASFDFDLDGRFDLLFLNGTKFPVNATNGGGGDVCYRNEGAWRFSNVTEVAELGRFGYSAGVSTGDFNQDGFPDAFINCFGNDRLYINLGDGTFEECAEASGVADPSWGTSAACLDFDCDGDLDIYSCNYAEWTWETNTFCGDREKNIRIFCSPRSVKPIADKFYENLGDGTFRNILSDLGFAPRPARGQGVVAADIDDDGFVDLYVGNDMNPNSFFRNKGDRTFEDLSEFSGAGVDFAGQIQAGMGVDVADTDRDGLVEIFVTNYEGEHNTFYQNLGNNVFQDVSQSKGLAGPSMKWVGWGTRFADLDLDGWQDLVITNGHTDNNLQKLGRDSEYEQPPLLFHNEKGRLSPVESPATSYFGTSHPGRSLCVVDLDQNLTPDIAIAHKDQPPALLRNDVELATGHLVLSISFVGLKQNRDGVGVGVEAEGVKPVLKSQIKAGGSYLSSEPYRTVLSLPADNHGELKIRWPGGGIEVVEIPSVSGRYVVIEGRGRSITIPQ